MAYIPARSEEERKKIKSIQKKSKKKRVHVYFNKKNENGQTKYITGEFTSKKNDGSVYPYRSSYELAYLEQLEADDNVVKFLYEPFCIDYIDSYKKVRKYVPDFFVLYSDGKIKIAEIKPEAMLQDYDVRAKAKAVQQHIAENYEGIDIEYQFVTEKMLFKSTIDYLKFLNKVKSKWA